MYKIKFLLTLVAMTSATCFALDSNALTAKYVMDLEAQLQMAFTDYDAAHSVLLERCTQTFPATQQSLAEAIEQWRNKNAPAQQQLRELLTKGLMNGSGLSEPEAAAQIARSSASMTQGLETQFAKLTATQLKPACDGQYATQTLASPMLDFGLLLRKLQAGQVNR